MDRQKFLGHVALAVTIILLAAFAGQIRRWQQEMRHISPTRVRDETPRFTYYEQSDKAEVIVKFRSSVSVDRINRLMTDMNDVVRDNYEAVNGLSLIRDNDELTANELASAYRALKDDVEYAEPSFEISLEPETMSRPITEAALRANAADPNDEMFGEQWSLQNNGQRGGKAKADINAIEVWKKTSGSEKVVVAVLDSGVDYTHPDLSENIWIRPGNIPAYSDGDLGEIDDNYGYNAVENNGDPMDDNGHGTHCAGIIGAEGDNNIGIAGINWHVKIMPLKFMSSGGIGSTKDAIEAINYVIDRKRAGVDVRIISASWGSKMKSKGLEDVIRKAGEEGIMFIAASGNSSEDADKSPHYPASYDLPNVISVAALTRTDVLAGFSNFGAKRVHLAAPGAEILSTWLDHAYREASGTSMATPVVVGVAALVLSKEPNISVEKLRARLLSSVDKLDVLAGRVASGGRLNAALAVGAK